MPKKKTASFYASSPESYAKKLAYNKKRNAKPKQKKYRRELAAERRARGIMGKGGPDVSHTSGGGYTLENVSANRARNGAKKGKAKSAKRTGTKK
jgi:hypothetical protein